MVRLPSKHLKAFFFFKHSCFDKKTSNVLYKTGIVILIWTVNTPHPEVLSGIDLRGHSVPLLHHFFFSSA